MPAGLNRAVHEVIRQQGQLTKRNLRQKRHDYLKIMYKELLETTIQRNAIIVQVLGFGHELLLGVHPSDSFEAYFALGPESSIMTCQIFLNHLEPIRRYLRSKDSPHFRYPDGQDTILEGLLVQAVKSGQGQYDLAREILDHGVYDSMKHDALVVAFEREDFLMLKLLLVRKYRHCWNSRN